LPPQPPAAATGSDVDEAAKVAALIAPVEKPPVLPDVAHATVIEEKTTIVTETVGGPTAMQPTAMKPAAAKKAVKPVVKTKPSRRLQPGDLICGQCGEGNPPARKFCSRCGESLETAQAVKTPWWRKLIPRRKVKTLEVGERPGKAGVKSKRKIGRSAVAGFRRVVTTAAVIVAFLVALVPPIRTWADNNVLTPVKNKWNSFTTQTFDPVESFASVTATAETPDNPAKNAVDLAGNTFWLSPASKGMPVLVLTFAQPVNLDRAIVQNGARDRFSTFSRAQKLHLVFSTNKSADIDLKDQPDPQKVTIANGHGITSVQIQVVQTYAAIGDPDVAISEIELFSKHKS
jgi:hypothetical protein